MGIHVPSQTNHSSALAIRTPDFFLDALLEPHKCSLSQRDCEHLVWGLFVRPVCRSHWKRKCWEVHLWASAVGPGKCCGFFIFFFPLSFAEVRDHTLGPSRAAPLFSPEGLLLLETLRAWTSYQLYQESFFPAKLVRALLSGNVGLKVLFSYFTDGLSEWFTRRVKD